eukprot:g3417.t1
MDRSVPSATNDEEDASMELQQAAPLYYPVANDAELLVLSVLESLPDWLIPLRHNSSTQSSSVKAQEQEISNPSITRKQRELLSVLKSRFGGEQGNPVLLHMLTSLEIQIPKQSVRLVTPEQRKKNKKKTTSPAAAPHGNLTATRSKRGRLDSNEVPGKPVKSPKASSSTPPQDIKIKQETKKSSVQLDEREMKARELHPWDDMCSENLLSYQFCLTTVAEALLTSQVRLNCTIPSPIIPWTNSPVTQSTNRHSSVEENSDSIPCPNSPLLSPLPNHMSSPEEPGNVLKSFPGLIRNNKLFALATNGASLMDPSWANKLDSQWPICDEELLKGECNIPSCQFQHKHQYLLQGTELESYKYSSGAVDFSLNAGSFDISLLYWSRPESSQSPMPIRNEIPLYKRFDGLEISDPRSSLFRLIRCDAKELRLRSIQPSQGLGSHDLISFSFGSPPMALNPPMSRDRGFKHAENVLVHALRIIDWGSGDAVISIPCRQKAVRFLLHQFDKFPNQCHIWQLYLTLLSRDPGAPWEYKLSQFKEYFSRNGPWYRGVLRLAAMYSNIEDKIKIYMDGAKDLLNYSVSSLETCRCTVDLFLRTIYLELKSNPNSFIHKGTSCWNLLRLLKKKNAKDSNPSGQSHSEASLSLVNKLHDELKKYPEELFLYGICVLHAYIYRQLPVGIVNSFGFCKKSRVLNWQTVSKSKRNPPVLEIGPYLSALMTNGESGLTFFASSASMRAKQVFVTNVLLLLEAAGLNKPVQFFQLFIPDCNVPVKAVCKEYRFMFLNLAEAIDEQFDKQYPVNCADHNGSGFILEHVMNHMFLHGRKNDVEDWIWAKEFDFDQPKGFRRCLAQIKLSFHFNIAIQARKVLKLIEDHSEEVLETTSKTEQALYFMCKMFGSILDTPDTPKAIRSHIERALKLAEDDPDLKQSIWNEAVLLTALTLPRKDPRQTHHEESEKQELSFSVVKEYLTKRQPAFDALMSLVNQYCKETVMVVKGLDNTPECNARNPRVRKVINPPTTFDICSLLDTLLAVMPHLLQSEVLKLLDFLVEQFGTSPSLVEFLMQSQVYLPDYDQLFLQYLIQVVILSVPCARFEVWKQTIKLSQQYGSGICEEIKTYANKLYPGWLEQNL